MNRFQRCLPVATVLALVAAAPSVDAAAVKSVDFIGMAVPKTVAQMSTAYSDAKVRVTYADGASEVRSLTYTALFRNTDRIGGNSHEAGRLYDAKGASLKDPNGDPVIAETPDGNSLLQLPGGEIYLLTHWESDWLLKNGDVAYRVAGWHARMPMTMSLSKIEQRSSDGRLTATSQRNVDFSAVGGLWIPCAASQTPWNTHLGSEEDYDLFNRKIVDDRIAGFDAVYFGKPGTANPYRYGYNVEVTVKPGDGTGMGGCHSVNGQPVDDKLPVMLKTGDVMTLEIPGSGGLGPASERSSAVVMCDVADGIVSPEAAFADYGVRAADIDVTD